MCSLFLRHCIVSTWSRLFSHPNISTNPHIVTHSAVPVFSGLVGLVGALFGAFLCIIVTGCMWLYDYGGNFMSQPPKQKILTVLNVLLVLCGTFLMVAGVSSRCPTLFCFLFFRLANVQVLCV